MATKESVVLNFGHPIGTENWEHQDMFCPDCGKKDVWREGGEGDYYQGPTHICLSCGADFTVQIANPEQLGEFSRESHRARVTELRRLTQHA